MNRPRHRGRRAPFERTEDGRVEVVLPLGARKFLAAAAEHLREASESPGSPGFDRLFGRIDEDAAVDDPAYVLARQMAVDDVVSVVSASAMKDVIEPDEAEAWVKLLGLTLSRRMAELWVRTEGDRDALGGQDEAVIRLVHDLQIGLVRALDDADPLGST